MIIKTKMGSFFHWGCHNGSTEKENENKVKEAKMKKFDYNFYDISLNIKNVKDISKEGWDIIFKDQIDINNEILKIGILGETKKGKSYIMQKLLDIKIDNDLIIKTRGLGIKYYRYPTEINNLNNFMLLDSEGIEKPLLDTENLNLLINNTIEQNDIEELVKEKLLKELFLQHLIIKYSDIPILVVDELNFSEQKLIAKIQNILKNNKKPKKLFVVHNLQNYNLTQEVKIYINEVLLKLAGINLKERVYLNTEIIEVNEKKNNIYFEQELGNETYNIIHLIMANEFSEAGNYYNGFAIQYLKNHLNQFNDIVTFSFSDIIIDNFIDLSKSILNETMDKSKFSTNKFNGRCIIKYNENITYKKHLDYQFESFNLYNNFIVPEYRYYINNNQLIIDLLVAGKTKDVECDYLLKNGYYYFNFTGEKIEDLNNNLEIKNYYCSTKNNIFKLKVAISAEKIILKSDDYNLEDLGNGILSFKFELYQKSKIKKTFE